MRPPTREIGHITDAAGDRLTVSTSRPLGLVNITVDSGAACLDRNALAELTSLLETAVLDLRKVHR